MMVVMKLFIYKIYNFFIEFFKPWGFCNSYLIFPCKMFFRRIGIGNKDFYKISSIKNIHQNERCFVIATGPSLKLEDLKKLKNEYTIGVNSIFKMYEHLDWVPTYYAMIDPTLTENIINNNNVEFDKYAKDKCFFNSLNRKIVDCDKALFFDVNWLDHIYNYGSKKFKYNQEIMYGIYDCYSITQMCVLIAIYMGFNEIYLIGADNNYLGDKQHFASYDGEDKIEYEFALSMQKANDSGYEFVKKIANNNSVNIYNATRGGNIKCFERVNIDNIL